METNYPRMNGIGPPSLDAPDQQPLPAVVPRSGVPDAPDFPPAKVHTPEDNREITLESIQELLASMGQRGQLVPGIVYPMPGVLGEWICADGNRRLACCRLLNIPFKAVALEKAPELAELILLRNTINGNRKEMDKAEIGADLFSYMELTGCSQEEAAGRFALSQGYCSKLLAPFKRGTPELLKALKERRIVATACPAIAALSPEEQIRALQWCKPDAAGRPMKRDAVERIVRDMIKGEKPKGSKQIKGTTPGGMAYAFPVSLGWEGLMAEATRLLKAAERGLKQNLPPAIIGDLIKGPA